MGFSALLREKVSFSTLTIEKVESSTLSVGFRDLRKVVLLQGKQRAQERLFHPISHVGISPVLLGKQIKYISAPSCRSHLQPTLII